MMRYRSFRAISLACLLAGGLACGLVTPAAEEAPPTVRPRVALVLEGGGALGLAHVGVIAVIEELGIPIDIVAGTSMGAIVGGLYAAGYDAARLKRLVTDTDWNDLFTENQTAVNEPYRLKNERSRYFAAIGVDREGLKGLGGLLAGNKILTYLDALVSDFPTPVDFDHLPRRFRAVATDIGSGEEVILKAGSLSEALRASMGIPGAFAPFVVDGRALVDGGVVNNLPVDVARALGAEVIIAVDPQGGFLSNREVYDRTPVESLSRTIDTMIRVNVLKQLRDADLVVTVDLSKFTAGDFSRGAAIMAQGEAAARDQYAALTGLRDRLGLSGAAGEDRPAPPAAAAIDRIRIAGGTEADRTALRRLLAPVVERQGGPEALTTALLAAYAERPLQSVRAGRDHTDSSVLAVNLQSRNAQGNTLRLGLRYAGTYADSVSSRLAVTPGLVLRDWGWPGTEASLDVEVLDALGLEAAFYQAFAAVWYAQASFLFRQDFDTFSFSSEEISSVDYLLYKTTSRMAGSLGLYPFPGACASLTLARNWNYDSVDISFLPDLMPADITVVQADLSVLRTDNPVFPMDGIEFGAVWTEGLPVLGAARAFRTLESSGAVYLSLGLPFSLGLLWKTGLDFSGDAASEASAPLQYKPDLADRRLFPNPLNADQQFGALTAAAGLDGKIQLDRLSEAMLVPGFITAQASLGMTLREYGTPDSAPRLHWNAGLGAGARLNDGFGLHLRVGGFAAYGDWPRPFLAIDLGSM